MRPTTVQHLRFLEHSLTPHDVLSGTPRTACPRWVRDYPFDVVVLHYSLLCMRWEALFERWRSTLDWIRTSDAVRLAMPQDEYVCAPRSTSWLVDLGVDCVFSVLDARHWPMLYPRRRTRTRIERTYTGFVDDRGAAPWRTLPRPHAERPLDIVYRARNLPFHIGHHGQLKHRHRGASSSPAARAPRPAHRHLDRLRGHEVRRRLVRVPGQRALRHRHRERLQRARSRAARSAASRPPWRAEHPDATFERVLRPPGAGLGRPRLHGDQPAPLRGRPDQDVPAAGRGRVRRHPGSRRSTTSRCARTSRTSTRCSSASPTRPRPRPSPSAPGTT